MSTNSASTNYVSTNSVSTNYVSTNSVWTTSVNKLCQQILSIKYVNKLCQQTLSTNNVNKLCVNKLCVNRVCQQIHVNKLCPEIMSTIQRITGLIAAQLCIQFVSETLQVLVSVSHLQFRKQFCIARMWPTMAYLSGAEQALRSTCNILVW